MRRIHCPFHPDDTASFVEYDDHYHCFGCGAHGTTKPSGQRNIIRARTIPKEDIKASLDRIISLPTKLIRGFELPYDDTGYYILYPYEYYYTKRLFNPEKASDKYRSPRGHKKPLFILVDYIIKSTLCVIEGQLNALSAAQCSIHDLSIVSPGAATDLNRADFLDYYLQYDRICIIVDKDAAGAVNGITLRDTLLYKGKQVVLHAVETDFNELYVTKGPQAVKEEIDRAMGLFSRVQGNKEAMPSPGEGAGEALQEEES